LPCRPAAEIKGSSDEMEKSYDVEDEEGVPLVPKEKEKHEQSAQQLAEEMMMEKNLGKFAFTTGVGNLVASVWLFASFPHLFIIYYSVKMFVLFGVRFYLYYQEKFHYFMLDFCYFGNFLLFAFLWLIPKDLDDRMFLVVWGVMNGPIAWAVIAFGNSLVFHSLDKTTSLYLHLTPAIVTYSIRWKLQDEYHVCVPGDEKGSVCSDPLAQGGYIVLGSMAYFFCHQIFYFVVVQLVCMRCNKEFAEGRDEKGQQAYWTSFRWLTKNPKSCMSRFVFSCGNHPAPFLYGLSNLAYACFTAAVAWPLYNYQVAHFGLLVVIGFYATWSGANFYYDVFSASQGIGRVNK